jgi:hypothetical protein
MSKYVCSGSQPNSSSIAVIASFERASCVKLVFRGPITFENSSTGSASCASWGSMSPNASSIISHARPHSAFVAGVGVMKKSVPS